MHMLGSLFRAIGGMIGWILKLVLTPVLRVLVPILVIALIIWVVAVPQFRTQFLGALFGGPVQIRTAPAVITSIRQTSTLVTSRFETEITVDVSKEGLFGVIGGEQVVVRARGVILAGVDLQRITEDDVTISGTELTIRIPPAQIVSQDMTYAQVVTNQGLIPGIDPALQTEAETRGRAALLEAACSGGILEYAEQDAQVALADLLRPLGFTTIRLTQMDPQPELTTGCP